MNNNSRPVHEKPVYKIIIPVRDFSLDKAIPQFAAAIDAQIDRDDASDDFIKEKPHSNIRSSSTGSMTRPYGVWLRVVYRPNPKHSGVPERGTTAEADQN
jgi:hypothetical protein